MEHVTIIASDVTKAVAELNSARLKASGGWWSADVWIGKGLYQFKCYGTWVQRAIVGEIKDGGPMDCSVRDFKAYLVNFMGGE